MSDFEEWFLSNGIPLDTDFNVAKRAFEAGQQSQQAKIDELQDQIDKALSKINGITRFINEDNPRDVRVLSVTVDCELSRILHILKGNKDD